MSRLFLSIVVLAWLTNAISWSQQVDPATAQTIKDPFQMDLDSLSNVKVTTASKFAEGLSDAPSVMTVVTKDELRRFGGTTLREILGRVAGLNVSSSSFGDRSIISVRGDQSRPDGGHVLFLINGRPTRENLQGGVSSDLLESFPVGVLERIEVIKGPGSVLYGSDAFSGVINLITQKADGTGFHASSAAGPTGAAASSEEFYFQRGELNIVEGGQYHQEPPWDVNFHISTFPGQTPHQNAVLRNEGTGGFLGIDYKGFSFMSTYTGLESPSFVRGIGDVRWKRGFADVGYSWKAAAKWTMTFNGTYTRALLDTPYFPSVHRDSYEGLIEWTNFIQFSDKDRLTFGSLYDHMQGTETYLASMPPHIIAQGGRNSGEIYAQYDHKLTDSLKLIGGVQADKIGRITMHAAPRAGILWNLTDHLTLKTLYGQAFHAPSLDDNLINHPGLAGNLNLLPEKVGTFDLQASFANNRLQASVDYYYSRQVDLIVVFGTTAGANYLNLRTPAIFQGFDSEGKYYLKGNWFLVGSLLYQLSDGNVPASSVAASIPTLGAKAGISYVTTNGAELSLFDDYRGHLDGYSGSQNPRPYASHSVDAHARFDLTKRWIKNDSHGIALFAHANDLTNQQLWLPLLGVSIPETLPFTRGRTILFGAEIWSKVNERR